MAMMMMLLLSKWNHAPSENVLSLMCGRVTSEQRQLVDLTWDGNIVFAYPARHQWWTLLQNSSLQHPPPTELPKLQNQPRTACQTRAANQPLLYGLLCVLRLLWILTVNSRDQHHFGVVNGLSIKYPSYFHSISSER